MLYLGHYNYTVQSYISYYNICIQRANLARERGEISWIITMAHHPMYCSTTDGDDCNHYESVVRNMPYSIL